MKTTISKSFILKSSLIIMFATLLSKLLGLAREQLSLFLFGGSYEHDAFIAAFKLPNALRNLLAEGAFSAAFIPIFSSLLVNKSKEDAYNFANKVLSLLLILSIVVTVIGIAFSHLIVPLFYKYPQKLSLAIELSQVMMPFIIFVSISAIIMGILNSMHYFLLPALAPLFANIVFIIIVLFTFKIYGINTLAYAVIASGVLYFVSQSPSLFKIKFKFKFNFKFKDENIKKFLKSFFPIAFGMAVFQLNLLVSVRFSSPFEGAIVAIDKTFIIMQLILSIFVTGISTVSLPTFSRYNATKDWDNFKQTFIVGIRIVLFFTIPAMLGVMALNTDISALIYRDIFQMIEGSAGKVTAVDIVNMGNCLFFFAPAMVSFGCVVILNRAFQGMKKYYYPFFTGIITVIANVLLILLFINTDLGFIGIPLSITLSSILNLILLSIILRTKTGKFPIRTLLDSASKIILSSVIMAVLIRFLKRKIIFLNFNIHTGSTHFIYTILLVFLGIIVYVVILFILKEKDLVILLNKIKKRFLKNKNKENNQETNQGDVTQNTDDEECDPIDSVVMSIDRIKIVSNLEDIETDKKDDEVTKEKKSTNDNADFKNKIIGNNDNDANSDVENKINDFTSEKRESYRDYKSRKDLKK